MATVGEAFIDFKAKTDTFETQAKDQVTGAVKKIALAAGAVFAGQKIFDLGSSAIDAARESQAIGKQTEAVIKSTGEAAGLTADQIADLATAQSNKNAVDDEAIQKADNLLLTFTNIKAGADGTAGIFGRASQAAIDMGAAMGGDASSSAIQLGKALNDPVNGISALTRVGVTFTDQQKEQIKTMQESGDVAGAQTVILDELSKEFGGSAEAQATAADRAKIAMGNLQETIGGLLIPVIDTLATILTNDVLPAVQGVFGFLADHTTTAEILAGVIGGVLVSAITAWVVQMVAAQVAQVKASAETVAHTAAVIAHGVATTATAIATGIWTAAQWALNAAMDANPIGAVILIVAALVVGVIEAYQHIQVFRDFVDNLWQKIQEVFGWVKDNWPLILAILSGPIGIAAFEIAKHWETISGKFIEAKNVIFGVGAEIVQIVTNIPGLAAGAFGAGWDFLSNTFKTVINAIIGFWNGAADKLSIHKALPKISTPLGDIGGQHIDLDLLPHVNPLAKGGVGQPGQLSLVGEDGPELGFFGQPTSVFPSSLFQEQMTNALKAALGGTQRLGGPLFTVQIDNVTSDNAEATGNALATAAALSLRYLVPDLRAAVGG